MLNIDYSVKTHTLTISGIGATEALLLADAVALEVLRSTRRAADANLGEDMRKSEEKRSERLKHISGALQQAKALYC